MTRGTNMPPKDVMMLLVEAWQRGYDAGYNDSREDGDADE